MKQQYLESPQIVAVVVVIAIFVITLIVFIYAWRKTEKTSALTIGMRNDTPILLITSYNVHGGFFWHVYNVLQALHVAEKYNMKPVVFFIQGLYQETRPHLIHTHTDPNHNWWNEFFESINETTLSHHVLLAHLRHARPWCLKNRQGTPQVLEFTRKSLKSARKYKQHITEPLVFQKLWRKWITPKPHILERVQRFKANKKWPPVAAMHYRGTDKLPGASGNEDNPKHCSYSFCGDLLETLRPSKKQSIFVASDEQPFIEYLKNRFGDEVIWCTNSLRSSICTSNFQMDTSACSSIGEEDDSEACKAYRRFIQESVHRGFPERSKYKKGEDVLVDVLLMSECPIFFRSRGNVSNFVTYINPYSQVVDLAAVC
jgi:hypothetical protein